MLPKHIAGALLNKRCIWVSWCCLWNGCRRSHPGPANMVAQYDFQEPCQPMPWRRQVQWVWRSHTGPCGAQGKCWELHSDSFLSLAVLPWPQNVSCYHFLHFCFLYPLWILEVLLSYRSRNLLVVCKCFGFLLLPSPQGWLLQPLDTLRHRTGRCFWECVCRTEAPSPI